MHYASARYSVMSIKNVKIIIKAKTEGFMEVFKKAEKKLKEHLSECKITSASDSQDASIELTEVNFGEAGAKGFRAVSEGSRLTIQSAHKNLFEKAFDELLDAIFANGSFSLSNFEPSFDTSRVYYDDFGAVGDGVTNDFFAIKRAHEFANEGGQTVMADGKKTYLISVADGAISVKTDIDFCGAKLIFDDRYVSHRENKNSGFGKIFYDSMLFRVDNDYPYLHADEEMLAAVNSKKDKDGYILRGLESGGKSEKINLKLGYPAMLLIKNAKLYSYIRYGFIGSEGAPQREVLLIDGDGNIDPSTPMLHDYKDITDIIIVRLDVRPISIKNASVETRASRVYHTVNYCLQRRFSIERPHVTFENMHHTISGEIPRAEPVRQDETGLSYSVANEGYYTNDGKVYDKDGNIYTGDDIRPFIGPGYYGFICIDITHDVYVKNCSFQSHVLYVEGTYDITAGSANKIVLEDCTQVNFFEKDEGGNDTKIPNMAKCWGVAGTNYCKNMDYIRCRLTRYDAHAGVVNGKVIDSEITVLRLIGGGDFLMEGTRIYARNNMPIQLREDYGASFNGTLTVRNCEIIDTNETGKTVTALISAPTSYTDMGYTTFFPNLIIENIKLDKTESKEIALVHSPHKPSPDDWRPISNVITDRREDPKQAFDMYYSTYNPEAWIEKHIKTAGGKLFGLPYDTVKNERGFTTLIVHDTKNRFPYIPPKFIEVKNNENNGYRLTLYNSSFFENTEIRANEENLIRVDAPEN